jgi:KUP system potassium uptake protein
MLTPAQSFSELTMHPVSMSSRLAHFQVIIYFHHILQL